MKKFYFSVNTIALHVFLRDAESLLGVIRVNYELIGVQPLCRREDIEARLWHVEMEVKTPFNIGLLITLAYVPYEAYSKRYSISYGTFKEGLFCSSCHKYSISPAKKALDEREISEVLI